MTVGLGTYAFFWQWHDTAESPLTLPAMMDRTADLGVSLFQICDYPLLSLTSRMISTASATTATAAACSWNSAPEAYDLSICAVILRSPAGWTPPCCAP